MKNHYDAIVLIGPPGSGKTFLGKQLHKKGVATYTELEPMLRKKFGSGEQFQSRIQEAGRFVWQSYIEQIRNSELPVAFEFAGVDDRPLIEQLQRTYNIVFVYVSTNRSTCIDRVVNRGKDKNISHTTDRDRMGRHYDLWHEKIFPLYHFAMTIDGTDSGSAVKAIQGLLNTSVC